MTNLCSDFAFLSTVKSAESRILDSPKGIQLRLTDFTVSYLAVFITPVPELEEKGVWLSLIHI